VLDDGLVSRWRYALVYHEPELLGKVEKAEICRSHVLRACFGAAIAWWGRMDEDAVLIDCRKVRPRRG
jgi:hypothetical protein